MLKCSCIYIQNFGVVLIFSSSTELYKLLYRFEVFNIIIWLLFLCCLIEQFCLIYSYHGQIHVEWQDRISVTDRDFLVKFLKTTGHSCIDLNRYSHVSLLQSYIERHLMYGSSDAVDFSYSQNKGHLLLDIRCCQQ